MKRIRWIGLAVATVVLGLIVSTPGLSAGATGAPGIKQGPWNGTSEQGLTVQFDVVKVNGALQVEPQEVEVLSTCEVTGDQLQLGFGGGDIPLHQDGSFKMRIFDPLFGDLRWSGKLGDTTGKGTISFLAPGLLKDDTSQLCPSGKVSWTAQAGAPVAGEASIHPAYRIHVSMDRSGHSTWSVTKG